LERRAINKPRHRPILIEQLLNASEEIQPGGRKRGIIQPTKANPILPRHANQQPYRPGLKGDKFPCLLHLEENHHRLNPSRHVTPNIMLH
jgi:hypothetical protein